jgi:tetratricopeptide (TPR) repeat protein
MRDSLLEIETLLAAMSAAPSGRASRQAGELKVVQRLCRLLIAGEPAEKPGVANSLLKQIRDARVAGATSAPDLAVVVLQWCLDRSIYGTDAPRAAHLHHLLGEAYGRRFATIGVSEAAERATEHYQAAMDLYARAGKAAECAASHHNLGLLYQSRGDREAATREFLRAIDYPSADLTREQRAQIRHDLALVYLAGDDAAAADNAIGQLETALTEIPERASQLRAELQTAMGLAYRYRTVGDEERNLQEATRRFTQALAIFTQLADTYGIAQIQWALGGVCVRRAKMGEPHLAARALELLREAQQFFTLAKAPAYWAEIEREIGTAMTSGCRPEDSERIRLELLHYRNALRVFVEIGDTVRARSTTALIEVDEDILRAIEGRPE